MVFEVVCSSVMSKLYRTVEYLAVNLFCSELYVVSYLVCSTSIPMDAYTLEASSSILKSKL